MNVGASLEFLPAPDRSRGTELPFCSQALRLRMVLAWMPKGLSNDSSPRTEADEMAPCSEGLSPPSLVQAPSL